MEHLKQLIFLIDAAKAIAGSDAEVARIIKQPRQRIHDWRTGRQPCPPEEQASLADIAGFDALETLARATVEKFEGTEKGDRLMRVLGKPSRAIGEAIGSVGAVVLAVFSILTFSPQIQCIER